MKRSIVVLLASVFAHTAYTHTPTMDYTCDVTALTGDWTIFVGEVPGHMPKKSEFKIRFEDDKFTVDLQKADDWHIVPGSVDYICDIEGAATISAQIVKGGCEHKIAISRVPIVRDLLENETKKKKKRNIEQIEVLHYAHYPEECDIHLADVEAASRKAGDDSEAENALIHPGHIHGDKD